VTEIGSTVRLIAEFNGLVDAEVVAENEHGIVLRLDPDTITAVTLKGNGSNLVKAYYGEVPDPDDPRLVWLGRAHYNTLLEVPK